MGDFHGSDSWQALAAVLWPLLQQKLKNAPWFPWLSKGSTVQNHLASALVALLTTTGLHLTGNSQTGWTLTIPPLATLMHVVAQWAAQHLIYKTAVQGPELAQQQCVLLGEIVKALAVPNKIEGV